MSKESRDPLEGCLEGGIGILWKGVLVFSGRGYRYPLEGTFKAYVAVGFRYNNKIKTAI